MSDFKRWVSYIDAYEKDKKVKNAGFVKMDVREGRLSLAIHMKEDSALSARLDVGLFYRQGGKIHRFSIGPMYLKEGKGEFQEGTRERDLFGHGISLEQTGGIWLTGPGEEMYYLASWEKGGIDIREFFPKQAQAESKSEMQKVYSETKAEGATKKIRKEIETQAAIEIEKELGREIEKEIEVIAAEVNAPVCTAEQAEVAAECPCAARQDRNHPRRKIPEPMPLETLPQPDLWESLCRYYPKLAPRWKEDGIDLLQIRPADIRYLPRRLWHYGSNSFLLHGYYHYKYLILGRRRQAETDQYILGVRGTREERECFSAGLFGFHGFLPMEGREQEGYWYTEITL